MYQAGDVITGAWLPMLKGVAVTQFQTVIAKWELWSNLLIYEKKTEIHVGFVLNMKSPDFQVINS